MANDNMNSPKDAAMAILAKAQKLLDNKSTATVEDIKVQDMKKSAEHTSGLHTVAYYGLDKHNPQQAALEVLSHAQDMLNETVSSKSNGMQKSAQADSGMHTVQYYGLAKQEVAEEIKHYCEDHKVKKDDKAVSKAECMKCEGFQKSEWNELYEDLAKMENPDENEIGTKFVKKGEDTENKKAPSNDMKPKIEEKPIERDNKDFETKPGHAPENDHREEPSHPTPAANPAAHGQGSNPPAGSTPGAPATPGTGKKGVHKLSFFMGHQHSKKGMKKGIALG